MRRRKKQVESEESLRSHDSDMGAGDSRNSEEEGDSFFNQGHRNVDEQSWMSENAK